MRVKLWSGVAAITLSLIAVVTTTGAAGNAVPAPGTRPDTQMAQLRSATAEVTGSIIRAASPIADVSELKAGLDALSARNAGAAIAVRDRMRRDSFDRLVLTWAIAVSGQKGIASFEIADAQKELKGWPGLETLRASSERALLAENPPAPDVLAAFGNSRPETTDGTIVLARALRATGRIDGAAALVRRLWREDRLDGATETRILAEFSPLLTVPDHARRMKMLMYRGRAEQAARFSTLGDAQSLYRAWAAVIRGTANADTLIAAVDPSWHGDPAYRFIRIEQLRKQDRYEEAARLLQGLPKDRSAAGDPLVDPGEWWVEQRVVSRGLADLGDFAAAYRVAAGHVATDPTDIIDAEFHAGWYALTGLNDGQKASQHFRRILEASGRPISASRALYWLGRAAEAGGPGNASDLFTQAARYPGTFYGQLAAARIGRTALNVGYPAPAAEDKARFAGRQAVQAIARLEAAGYGWRADGLYRALAGELTSPGELALLATQAERKRGHQLSLQIGKLAFGRGIDVAALAFPLGVIPGNADIAGSGKALAYAIARQESAFDPAAISPADARGLLQILPGTARGVAGRHGLAYNKARLTTDAAYNATLGAHYLGEQIDSFGGSYILTFIAYNAGPRRVPQWIARYGDPRGMPIDAVVDWIERIPFVETRNYVQRVMENYQVYKSRLGQKADIVNDLRSGRS